MRKDYNMKEYFADVKAVPEVWKPLLDLCKEHGNLFKILKDPDGAQTYHSLMLYVIKAKEIREGHLTYEGLSYRLDKDTNDIIETYGNTFLLPLL